MLPPIFSAEVCLRIAAQVPAARSLSGGNRCLLDLEWCDTLARQLAEIAGIAALLPPRASAVQCTYFEKSPERNWLVPLHQDLSIPVAERVPEKSLGPWSEKDGHVFVQAPGQVLNDLVAVRLHLDACTADQGALRVVPGSHLQGILQPDEAQSLRDGLGEQLCPVAQGGVMAMRPLLLHASSKSRAEGRRRVLHFLFGPADLPNGLRWRRWRP